MVPKFRKRDVESVQSLRPHTSALIHQPSSLIHHPSSIIHQPSSIIHQPSSISPQPSAIFSGSKNRPGDQLTALAFAMNSFVVSFAIRTTIIRGEVPIDTLYCLSWRKFNVCFFVINYTFWINIYIPPFPVKLPYNEVG